MDDESFAALVEKGLESAKSMLQEKDDLFPHAILLGAGEQKETLIFPITSDSEEEDILFATALRDLVKKSSPYMVLFVAATGVIDDSALAPGALVYDTPTEKEAIFVTGTIPGKTSTIYSVFSKVGTFYNFGPVEVMQGPDELQSLFIDGIWDGILPPNVSLH